MTVWDKPCDPLWHLLEGTYTSWVLHRDWDLGRSGGG